MFRAATTLLQEDLELMVPMEPLASPAATMPPELPLEQLVLPLKEPLLLLHTDLVLMEPVASQAQESQAAPPMEQLELPEQLLTLLEELQLKVPLTEPLPEPMALLPEPTEPLLAPTELQALALDMEPPPPLQEHHRSHLLAHQEQLEPPEHQEAPTLPTLPITTENE